VPEVLCPRCGVPLLDEPDYCWSCGYFVGDRWRTVRLGEGSDAEPRIVGPDETVAADEARPWTPAPARRDRLPGRVLGLAFAAIIVVVVGGLLLGGVGRSTSPGGPTAVATTSATTFPPTPTSIAFAPTGLTVQATVVRVIDGDTIVVDLDGQEVRVRYIGMDTPESVEPGTPVAFMATEAADANARLLGTGPVILETDVSDTDRFGRLLRNVWVERDGAWAMVGLDLVSQGYAHVTTFPPDVKYVDMLLAAQEEAREAGRGLWGASPPPS